MAVLTASEYFDLVAPELADSGRKDAFLALAELQMASAAKWGNLYYVAQAYLGAHLLTGSPDDGSAADAVGAVTNKSAGDLSVARAGHAAAALTPGDAALVTTRYGLEYMRLRNMRADASARIVHPGY